MAEMILVTGGSRSGKSSYAQKRAEALPGPRAFLATCPILDDEMALRCRKHRESRAASQWDTIEEETDLARVIGADTTHRVILVDCLTLWVNNLMYDASQKDQPLTEDDMAQHCRRLLEASAAFSGTILWVTNEVGMGIVPDNAQSRLFRDLAGRCNQILAGASSDVVLMVSGIALPVKKRENP